MATYRLPFPKPRFALILALVWGLPLLYFAIMPIWQRTQIEISGRILQRSVQPYDSSNPARIFIIYIIEPRNGKPAVRYIASNTTTILYDQEPPIGAFIQKDKWHLTYTINGKPIDDFSLGFQVIIGIIGFGLVGFGVVRVLQAGIFVKVTEQRYLDESIS